MTTATAPPPMSRPAPPTRGAPLGAPSSNGSATRTAPRLARVEAGFPPPRIVLNAVEGFGKTTIGAYAPEPALLMARGETGYRTLLGAGLVPSVDAADIETWSDLLGVLDEMIAGPGAHKTLVLDAMGGFERLCHETVCTRDFGGDWGEKGFGSFQKGYDVAVNDWLQLLSRLDRLRAAKGTIVLLLSHCKVSTFKNPAGPDYDRYISDLHHKTWGVTAKWADAVLFGNFFQVVEEKKGRRAKGIGGTDRVIYTERRDAWDAKNRYGMAEQIDLSGDPAESWDTLWRAIRREE